MLSYGYGHLTEPSSASLRARHRRSVTIDARLAIFLVICALTSLTSHMQMPRPANVIYVDGAPYVSSDVGVNSALKAPTGQATRGDDRIR